MQNKTPFTDLKALIDSGAAQDAVDFFTPRGKMAIACQIDGSEHLVRSDLEDALSVDTRVNIGCVVKNLTALLIAIAASDGLLDFEDDVARYLPEYAGINGMLRIRHLLSNSHGLDGSLLESVPYRNDEYIDAALICREVRKAPTLFRPGTMYYYWGFVGHWIAAAIIERIYQRRFLDLLRDNILQHIDLSARQNSGAYICPASGGVDLSARELLRLCRIHLEHFQNGYSNDAIRRLSTSCDVPLPRWPPHALGIGLGWSFYVGATLGSMGPEAMIMISPNENSAMAITGRAHHFARHQMFGPLAHPEHLQQPRLLSLEERRTIDVRQFAGLYRKASLSLEIRVDGHGELRALIYRNKSSGDPEGSPYVSRRLIPAVDNTFYPIPPESQVVPFIRFESIDREGLFSHAVNGKHVFRRFVYPDGPCR